MSTTERQLTKLQKDKMDALIRQWEKDIVEQVETLPDSDGKTLDGPRTMKRLELERKYRPLLQSILEEVHNG